MVQNTTTRLFRMFDELVNHGFYWSAATLWHEMLLLFWGQRLALRDPFQGEPEGFSPEGPDMANAGHGRLAGTLSQMWQLATDGRDRGAPDLYEEILTMAGMELLQVRSRGEREDYCLLIELLMEVWEDGDGRLIDAALIRAEP